MNHSVLSTLVNNVKFLVQWKCFKITACDRVSNYLCVWLNITVYNYVCVYNWKTRDTNTTHITHGHIAYDFDSSPTDLISNISTFSILRSYLSVNMSSRKIRSFVLLRCIKYLIVPHVRGRDMYYKALQSYSNIERRHCSSNWMSVIYMLQLLT